MKLLAIVTPSRLSVETRNVDIASQVKEGLVKRGYVLLETFSAYRPCFEKKKLTVTLSYDGLASFKRARKFAKSGSFVMSVCTSICPTRLLLNGFW
jgi:hypothetical protein